MNIFIPTLILWVTTALLVVPLAERLTFKKLNIASNVDIKTLPEEEQKKIEKVFTKKFILLDIVILGIVGLIGGLFGYFFIGISLDSKGWPGMVAFILMSFLGLGARGGL